MTEEKYSPDNWHWDPNNKLPVYVMERFFTDDIMSQDGRIEYALVHFPRIVPNSISFMGNMDLVWMVATDLVPIRQHCEFQL